jgi:hypothetical protein
MVVTGSNSVRHNDSMGRPKQGFKMGLAARYEDVAQGPNGKFIIDLRDSRTGEVLHYEEKENLITRDGGILAAMCFAAGATMTSGITMLAVGTGATGPVLNPDVADARQRHLNAEIARKPFSSVTFRTSLGAVSAVPTNIVDYTTIFGEAEAVGALNEMCLLRTISMNPLVLNPVPSVFPAYDTTIDLTLWDIQANALTFGAISKPNLSILTLTWRLTH